MDEDKLGADFHDVNVLTVIANESYQTFAAGLEKEISEAARRTPAIDEKFELATFHDPNHGYNTLRVFQASQDGRPFVWAKTSWLLLDLAAGRPVKPIAHLPEITSRDTQDIAPEFRDIPEFESIDLEREVVRTVGFHDLDYNGHVNNAAYFEWIYDATPVEFAGHQLKSVSASFRSGAKFGEKVTLRISRRLEELCFCYELLREGVAKPSAHFLCTWGTRNV